MLLGISSGSSFVCYVRWGYQIALFVRHHDINWDPAFHSEHLHILEDITRYKYTYLFELMVMWAAGMVDRPIKRPRSPGLSIGQDTSSRPSTWWVSQYKKLKKIKIKKNYSVLSRRGITSRLDLQVGCPSLGFGAPKSSRLSMLGSFFFFLSLM